MNNLNINLAHSRLTSQQHQNIAGIIHKNQRGEGLKSGLPSLSLDHVVEASQRAGSHSNALRPEEGTQVTYTLGDTSQSVTPAHTEPGEFSDAQKNRIRETFEHFSDAAKVKFKESAMASSNHVQIKIDNANFDWKDPYYINSTDGHSDVPLLQRHANDLEKPNNYANHIIAKALAFKLGLPSTDDVTREKKYAENTLAHTLRSPYSEGRSDFRFGKGHLDNQYSSTPMMDDISLLQKKYGANHETRSTDTVYGFNSNADREVFKLTSDAELPVFCVWDGGGKDTFDFSKYKEDQVINLTPGSFSNVGGGVGNVSIAQGVTIERAIGGEGDDILIGNEKNNELLGGGGDDMLYVAANSGYNKLWGGPGQNTFVIGASAPEAQIENTEIKDFMSGRDRLGVSALRAASGRSDLKVVNQYTGRGGEVTIDYFASHNLTLLRFDINGDRKDDCLITVNGKIEPTDILA
ncbi:serralysin [Pseudomonas cedrina]|uniref:Peptidase M10 serralysin C-terminal domain-containing protein n=2 Tax=Pseudomonas cedrina TaxID=651740 RepID=A0A1V2KA78_PSECE|nr:M10 family metallopeptidase C-terminal domain-containing protein [Pseudomonas cedrina]ONH54499.1 hypothetical protein BLL36_12565 [Pseudomonas cedrina subsp. cedrina]SDT63615.1 serralysin [Pseudomonas cedrina]